MLSTILIVFASILGVVVILWTTIVWIALIATIIAEKREQDKWKN